MTLVFWKKNHKKIQLLIMLIITFIMGGAYADEENLPYDATLDALNFHLVKIDPTQLSDPEYEATLITKACRMFTTKEAKEIVRLDFLTWKERAVIPLLHSLSPVKLKKSTKVKALITGAAPFRSEVHKAVCLNHLAYAITRNIPYYYFFHVNDFEQTRTTYPYAIKIPAIMAALSNVNIGDWVLWVDDDIITSDFMSHSYHAQFALENTTAYSSDSSPLADRAIKVGKTIRNLEIKDQEKDNEDDTYRALPAVEMIVTKDVDRAVMNTGMIWIRNTRAAKELIQLWWHYIKEDQFPVKDESHFYCYKTDKNYQNIHDCLQACKIKHPLQHGFCSPDKGEEERQHDWRKNKERSLFDQDVLKMMHRRERWSHEPERNPIVDRLVIIPQRGDFGIKNDEGNPVEEGLNAFFRTNIHIEESVRAFDPMLDKWTHMSGIPWGEREGLILTWMANIHNYPLKPEIIPGVLCGRLGTGPLVVYSDSTVTCPTQECPTCPFCPKSNEVNHDLDHQHVCDDLNYLAHFFIAVPSAIIGALAHYLFGRLKRRLI